MAAGWSSRIMVFKLKQNFRKNKVVTGKTLKNVLKLTSDKADLYGSVAFSILVRSTEKQSSSFSKRVFVFQKTCFKVTVLKTFKISSKRKRCLNAGRSNHAFLSI